MGLTVLRGTRETPVEYELTEEDDASTIFVVFIDGKRTHFLSAMCYLKWAGKSLGRPFAKNLAARLPADWQAQLDMFCEVDEGASESDYNSEGIGETNKQLLVGGCRWGDSDGDY